MRRKTGLAPMIREWARDRKKPWSPAQAADALEVPPGKERDRLCRALQDFCRRGELEITGQKGKAYLYRYNRAFKTKGRERPLKNKILKAIHYSETFTAVEIDRLVDGASRSHIHKTIKALVKGRYVEAIGEKKRDQYYGLETVYRVVDRDRFRKEVL